jgi:hypothetical protein
MKGCKILAFVGGVFFFVAAAYLAAFAGVSEPSQPTVITISR